MEVLTPADLSMLSLNAYLKKLESILTGKINLSLLTALLTTEDFKETRPLGINLYTRHLKPVDSRFNQIEILYTDQEKVTAIRWDLIVSLQKLTELFGPWQYQYEPYSESTAFFFKSKNPQVAIIKTRYPSMLTFINDKGLFQSEDQHNKRILLENPEFSFVQFDLLQ